MEMNMFIPQSIQSQLELANIADVKRQIITPRYSRPIIELKQDTPLGSYAMTGTTRKLSYNDAMNLAMYCNNVDIFSVPKEEIDTRKLYSLIIPALINYSDSKVNINNGKLLDGAVSGTILNQKIVSYSWDRHGPDTTKNFFDNAQRLVTNWLLMNGFSVGLGDATTDRNVLDDIKSFCEIRQMEVDKLITEMENNPDTLDPETFESNILSTLKASDGDITKKVVDHLKKNNPANSFFMMVDSKAKGSQGNIGHIIGGLGQDVLEFKRIMKKVNHRTLPHFFQNDDRASARGFIPNSYFHGLTPKEFFFHHMTAREGMIDTAIKSVTGDTPIVIIENNVTKYVNIGDWIDNKLLDNVNKVQHIQDRDMELFELPNSVYIPTTDMHGNVSWGLIKNITRHDPGNALYEINTSGGRKVIVTESHSLLIWNNETSQFEQKSTPLVHVGDRVPVTKMLPKYNNALTVKEQRHIDIMLSNKCIKYASIQERDEIIMAFNMIGIYLKYDNKRIYIDNSQEQINNVVLDTIISINPIDISKYNKVYDLTVPSTLNFGLANGLHVVDTAESGYLQRKLIKGMEDLLLAYDKTVRSGNNVIMQMIYGDNGISQPHYKDVEIKLINMSNTEVKKMFCFTDDELNNLSNEFKFNKTKFVKWNNDLFEKMKSTRDELREVQMKARMNYITLQSSYQLPVNFGRIVEDAKNAVIDSKQERLNPLYIEHAINFILRPDVSRLNILNKDYDESSIKFGDQQRAKYLFKVALLEYLSPRRCIFEYKLTKQQFDQMVLEIIKSFRKACLEPGEMVGVLTAQSLGETLTQMSCQKNTQIIICEHHNGIRKMIKTKVGDFIDGIYDKYNYLVQNIPNHTDSTEMLLDEQDKEYYICGVNNDETITWNKISHISRHPSNGNLLRIKTNSGRTVTTTKSHNFLKRTENGIIAITADQLQKGIRIPVARNVKFLSNNEKIVIDGYELNLTKNMGWFIGAYLAEGSLIGNTIRITNIAPEYYNNVYELTKELNIEAKHRNYQGEYGPSADTTIYHPELANIIRKTCGDNSFVKRVPSFVHNSNIEFVRSLLKGYIDGDGNIASDRKIIRAGSRSEELIDDLMLLLSYNGIFTSKYTETKKNNQTPLYCFGIPHKYTSQYLELIGTDFETKKNDINVIIEFSISEHQYNSEVIDKIPELGNIIARLGTTLKMPGNSRTYGVWKRREMSIGRRTLYKYIERFTERANELNMYRNVSNDIEYLKMIYNGDVIWDEIVQIEEIQDPKEYVYDFTIPKNQTFMLYSGICVHNTLNSVSYTDKIAYKTNNNCHIVQIGEMIDDVLDKHKDKIVKINNNTETEYLDISECGYKVQSVDENGKIHWKLIEAVTRHLPGGNVIKVKTLTGREVVATKSKSFLMRRDNKLIDIEGSQIKVGDRLPVQKNAPKLDHYLNEYNGIELNEHVGFAVGVYLKNKILTDDQKLNEFIIKSCDNNFPSWTLVANDKFVTCLLNGYLINDHLNENVMQTNKQILFGIAELLSRFGKISKINNNVEIYNNFNDVIPGVNIGGLKGEYSREELKERLTIMTGNNRKLIDDTINEDVYYDEIVEIIEAPLNNFTPDHDKVYDLTVADTRNFNMFGGLCMRDTFHSSGVGVAGMQGIPRFREIMSYSKNIQTPCMIIKLTPDVRTDQNIAHKIEALLKHTIFGSLVEHMDIIYDPNPDNFMKNDNINNKNVYYINGGNIGIENLPWLYRFKISRESMLEDDITLLDIKTKFVKYWGDFSNDSSIAKKKIILSRVVNGCVMSNFDNSEQPIIHIRFDVNNPDNYTLVEIGQYMLNKISMKGVATIEKVDRTEKQKIIEYDDDKAVKQNANEYVIYTSGIDLNKIKTNKYIDFNTTYINDVYQTYINFGIEAARTLIVKEIETAYSGNSINITHLALLADVMCNTGTITSIDRHGINRLDTDPLSRASFEKTVEQLIMASAFNEVDHMRSVSSRIMAGRCIKGGTGMCDVIMDSEMIENSEMTIQHKYIDTPKAELEESNLIKDTLGKAAKLNMFMP